MKVELIALAVLLPLVLVLGLAIKRFPALNNQPTPTVTPFISPTPAALSASPLSGQATRQANSTTTPGTTTSQNVSLSVIGNGQPVSYQVAISQKTLVIDVLKAAQAQGLTLLTKDFGGSLGIFIESINGLKNNQKPSYYWQFYVNGQRSSLGVSSASVSPGDRIEWKDENEN